MFFQTNAALRRRAAQGDLDARSRLLEEGLRSGQVDPGQVWLLAYLGDAAAAALCEAAREAPAEVPSRPWPWSRPAPDRRIPPWPLPSEALLDELDRRSGLGEHAYVRARDGWTKWAYPLRWLQAEVGVRLAAAALRGCLPHAGALFADVLDPDGDPRLRPTLLEEALACAERWLAEPSPEHVRACARLLKLQRIERTGESGFPPGSVPFWHLVDALVEALRSTDGRGGCWMLLTAAGVQREHGGAERPARALLDLVRAEVAAWALELG